jgi:uncharacterized membrane protein YcaP (DUF421 family)
MVIAGIVKASWRTLIAIVLAMVATRLLNKQFVARLTYFDFTLGVIIGSLVGHIPNDYQQPFWPVVIPLLLVTALGILIGWLAAKFEPIRHLLQGEPTVLIQNGKLLDDNMRRLRYNLDQLNSQLRAAGVWDVAQVEFAVLEPGGRLSVLLKSQYKPVTPHDLNMSTRYDGMAIELIMDGNIVHKNLKENGLSEDWLHEELRRRGITNPSDVYFACLNTRGEVYTDLFHDHIHRPVDIEGKHPSTPPSPTPLA